MRAGSTVLLAVLAVPLCDGASALSEQTGLKRFGEPKPRLVAAAPGAVCIEVSSDIHVCKAKAQTDPFCDLLLLVGGDVVARWPGRSPMYVDRWIE